MGFRFFSDPGHFPGRFKGLILPRKFISEKGSRLIRVDPNPLNYMNFPRVSPN